MRYLKRTFSIFLIVVIFVSSYLTVFAAPTTPVSSSTGFINAREIFGYENKVYTVAKENGAYVRSEPHNQGSITTTLPYGYPITVKGMYQTPKGTNWFLIQPNDLIFDDDTIVTQAWIYAGNTEVHTHTYKRFDNYQYEFCTDCGHVHSIGLISLDERLDSAEIALSLLSLIPCIGNGFDVVGGLLSLSRGHVGDALLNFTSAIPILGTAATGLSKVFKIGDTVKVSTRTADFLYLLEKVDGGVEIKPIRNTYRLGKHMDTMFELTGLQRYNKYDSLLPRNMVNAHHIVAIEEPLAKPARDILMSLSIDPNGSVNGVYLCQTSNICGGALHQYLHSSKYYSAVNERITKAYTSAIKWADRREAVIIELDKIATALVKNNSI